MRARFQRTAALRVGVGVGVFVVAACVSSQRGGGGALEPRFVALHNAFSAIGLSQVGPIREGLLLEGHEARLVLPLPAGCITIVALAGSGVRDIDATLLDGRGVPLAHDTTSEPQAVLRPCLETADDYTLVVRAAVGQGDWVVATWAGGVAGAPSTVADGSSREGPANGTCAAPIPWVKGIVSSSTTHGEHENAGSCGPSDSRELVYELSVAQRERVEIVVEAKFDSVLYVRKDDCDDANAEVDCNDDSPDRAHSRIDRVLEPGKYFVFVDGYGQEAGPFKMTVNRTAVLAIGDACRHSPLLVDGFTQAGTTWGMANDARATCGGGAQGADAVWRAELAVRSRVRVVEHSDDTAPVVHVRRVCADEQSEVACGESGAAVGDAATTGVFEPGTYAVFADAHERVAGGRYTLRWETAGAAGTGATSDACGDAHPLVGPGGGVVEGDTFPARDDVAGSCGGAGAADVVYRLDVPRRSRIVASLDREEAPHVIIAFRRCGDRTSEVACGRTLNQVVAPGTYFVAIDGASSDAFGRFTLTWALRDLTGQSSACASVPRLLDGRPVHAATNGAGDRFATSCGSAVGGASGPDRVFKFELAARAKVRVAVTSTAFDALLALRKACADAASGPLPDLACEADPDASHRTTLERALEPGTYWVVVDGQSPNDEGPFDLEYRIVR